MVAFVCFASCRTKTRRRPYDASFSSIPCRNQAGGIHIYEALSYVWGSEENKQPIYVQPEDESGGSSCLLITANLHEALSYLRDRVLERVIWIDAVCIDQEDKDEKKQQVQSMARIYANASRVIVWLGKAAGDSDQALEALRRAAAGGRRASPAIDEPSQQAILTLLERPWFQRIWVLQEVAAARYVLIKCGSSAIDGHTFCSGLDESKLSYDTHPALRYLIPPITYLIRDAVVRPQYATSLPETASLPSTFSLNIRPLGELVDMFHTREATNPLDKVYALLGMSSDDPRDPKTAGLYEADYTASWAEVFRKLIQFSLSDQVSVDTWNKQAMAVVRGKGHILGKISLVDPRGDAQSIGITWKNSLGYFDVQGEKGSQLLLQPSAKLLRPGDAVCLLQGSSKPTIVRPRHCYSEIITIAAPLTDSELSDRLGSITTSPIDFVLIWDWDASQRRPQDQDYETFMDERGCPFDKAARSWNFGVLLNGMEIYEDAGGNLQKAVEVYRAALKSTGDHPGHGGETLKMIRDLVIGAANDAKSFNDQTPLLWAAKNGHKAVVKLLLDKGPGIEMRDSEYLRTPLSWAAGNGDEALVELLLGRGAAIETEDDSGRTPLQLAAQKGHEAVTKLLVKLGANKEAKDGWGWTPLQLAAQKGHEAVTKLLAAELGADKKAEDRYGQKPLHQAARNGHEAVVRLLAAELGADKEAKDCYGQRPLHLAVENGHEAVVRLLAAELGADKEAEDYYGQRLLHLAAENGHEAVVRLLAAELGADKEAEHCYGQRPLHLAAKNGHEAVVRLLAAELGADKEAEDRYGQRPLHLAAKNGHEAVVRLLAAELGADKEAEDRYGQRPLHLSWKRARAS
ncbi:hypothetical protein MAPG_04074 [Magnaporthiopsis poae ATCC 64411]|uniref:Heterokaryon incompatibility domain-containing protein n=1 Tax=Magnaporthiopsis poae (strain ATCC 64411 / 73-15) TaxID=644358 RepID=A0A0C4DVR3_MAGP6|nr:hypothetical protein MAPG_04074 [Magnaporthiopsis poae ATCC 64411]